MGFLGIDVSVTTQAAFPCHAFWRKKQAAAFPWNTLKISYAWDWIGLLKGELTDYGEHLKNKCFFFLLEIFLL